MALKTDSELEVMSLVLTKDQASDLRRIRAERTNGYNRVSISDVAREVVAEGLRVVSCVQHSDFSASDESSVAA